jgi:hypothetical protein
MRRHWSWRFSTLALAACLGACPDVLLGPPVVAEYALESIDDLPLPVELLKDFDMSVSVVSDVIQLRSDSTFLEIAVFKGVSSDTTISVTDSASGTYTASGTTMFFLMTSAKASRMTIDGATLKQDIGRRFVYRRR